MTKATIKYMFDLNEEEDQKHLKRLQCVNQMSNALFEIRFNLFTTRNFDEVIERVYEIFEENNITEDILK